MVSESAHPIAPRTAARARAAVIAMFFIGGSVTGSWAGRIPTVKAQVGLSDGEWGLVILAQPIAALLGLLLVTRLIQFTSARTLAIPGAIGVLLISPIAAGQHTVWALVVCLVIQGFSNSILFTPINALSVLVQRMYTKSVMSSIHAAFSVGQLAGALAGVVAGQLGVGAWEQLAVTNVILAGVLLASVAWVPKGAPPPVVIDEGASGSESGDHVRARRLARPSSRGPYSPQLFLLMALALLTTINEGAAALWSAQYAVSLGESVAMGALTLTCFSVATAISRLFGDRVADRLGVVPFLKYSIGFAAVGLGIIVATGSLSGALIGFALFGLGSGCIFPMVMSLAGYLPGISAGRAVALITLGQWPAFLLGPPVIGMIADVVTLRFAFLMPLVAALISVALATKVPTPPEPGRSST